MVENLEERLIDAERSIVAIVPHRLEEELKLMQKFFNSNRPIRRWHARFDFPNEYHGHFVLVIDYNKGLTSTIFDNNPTLAVVFPQKAGGDTNNVYDAILNKKVLGNDTFLPRYLEETIQQLGSSYLGKFHYADTLDEGSRHIISTINPSYDKPFPFLGRTV